MACIVFPRQHVVYPGFVTRCHRPCLRRRCGSERANYLLRELARADDGYFDGWYSQSPYNDLFLASLLEHLVNRTDDKEGENKTDKSPKKGDGAENEEKSSDAADDTETTEEAKSSTTEEGPENFKLVVSVGNFKPEHLKLSVNDGKISITGKYVHEMDHGNGVYSIEERHFRQTYKLPENVNTDELTSKLSENGLLTFEAPLNAVEAPKERLIPLTDENQSESLESAETEESVVEDEKPTVFVEPSANQESFETSTTEPKNNSEHSESMSDIAKTE